jgi:hypothetical protein
MDDVKMDDDKRDPRDVRDTDRDRDVDRNDRDRDRDYDRSRRDRDKERDRSRDKGKCCKLIFFELASQLNTSNSSSEE